MSSYDGVIICTQDYFDNLREYSASLPTGTLVGKQWKANYGKFREDLPDEWIICEYVDHPDPKKIGVKYWRPEIQEASPEDKGE